MADNKSLSTYHISSNLEQYEVARSGFFTLIIEDLDELVRSDFNLDSPSSEDILTNGQKVIELSVDSASIPHFTVGTKEIRRGNSSIKVATTPSFEDISITCTDFVGLQTKDVLMAWKALTYDVNSDKGGRMGNWTDENGISHQGYKKNATLIEYTQDHRPIRSWTYIGCFITSISESEFNKESDDLRKITVKISVDRAVMNRSL